MQLIHGVTPTICIVDTFRDHSSQSGGHAIRVSSLASSLVKKGYRVLLVRPGNITLQQTDAGLNVITIGQGKFLSKILSFLGTKLFPNHKHFVDMVMMNSPSALSKIRPHLINADLVQLEDPTLFGPLLIARLHHKRIVADTDSIASQILRESAKRSSSGLRAILAYSVILFFEGLWCRFSSTITTSSIEDKLSVSALHHLRSNKIVVVPNPLDVRIGRSAENSSVSIRGSLGLSLETPVALFIGNLQVPHNSEAVDFIARIIPNLPTIKESKVHVVVVGRFDEIRPSWRVPNLMFTGPVKEVLPYIQMANVCIAPLFSQVTGVKTKVLTYLAYGKPTIATAVALTGLDPSVRRFVIECDGEHFPSVLAKELIDGSSSVSAIVSKKVQSLYGADEVASEYARVVLAEL